MAVGAQQLQVLEPVVQPIAIDVMKRERQPPPQPVGEAASFTFRGLEPRCEEPELDVVATAGRPCDEELLERELRRPRIQLAALDGCVPSRRRHREAL
jgi:hypothetical protein